MSVTVKDVRDMLAGVSEEALPDLTIAKCIDVAEAKVNSYKGKNATDAQIKRAVLLTAAWYAMVAYASHLERSLGEIPPAALERLRDLEKEKDDALAVVKRASDVFYGTCTMDRGVDVD